MHIGKTIQELITASRDLDLTCLMGDPQTLLQQVVAPGQPGAGNLAFVWTKEALELCQQLRLSQRPALVVSQDLLPAAAEAITPANYAPIVIATAKAEWAMVTICQQLMKDHRSHQQGIHPTCVVDPSAQIASDAQIGPYSIIGAGVTIASRVRVGSHVVIEDQVAIGADSVIMHHVTIGARTTIGQRAVIKPGAVLATDGFGFLPHNGANHAIPHLGTVTLGDDVQLGANNCVDRGKIEATIIGDGTKLDNLCHVGHNVQVGRHCLLAAQSGIGGTSKIGDRMMAGGQTGIYDHVTIPADTAFGFRAGVTKSIAKSGVYANIPHMPLKDFLKSMAVFKVLPQLKKDIDHLKGQDS